MNDTIHRFTWPIACVACGKAGDYDSLESRKAFSLYGGQTSQKVGLTGHKYHYYDHYAKGTAHICQSCYEDVRRIEEAYIPKLKKFKDIMIAIGLILIPSAIMFGIWGGFHTHTNTPGNLFVNLMLVSMLLVVVFCTLGMSGSDASEEFDRAGWASFYISYKLEKHFTTNKDVIKFSSRDYADKFREANSDAKVVVGRTHRSIPIKKPNSMACCIGGIIPIFIIFVVLGILGS